MSGARGLLGASIAAGMALATVLACAGTTDLGTFPLCEPSAAVAAPWDASLILLGDDEVTDGLFGFVVRDGRLDDQRGLPLPSGASIDNIEALAAAGDELIVVGSHSRDKQCKPRPDRHRILIARWDRERRRLGAVRMIDSWKTWRDATKDTRRCLEKLFVSPAPELAEEVCRAIVEAEIASREGTESCGVFNVEGGLAVPSGSLGASPRFWLGLRSPLAGSAGILLRLAPALDSLRFDAAALIELGGRGVRELALRGSSVWGIAGPPGRTPGSYQFWRIPAASLATGGRIVPEILPPLLPDPSEGIVFDSRGAVVVVDGDRGGKKHAVRCRKPGRQMRIEGIAEP